MGCSCAKSNASEPDTRSDHAMALRLQQQEVQCAQASASTSSHRAPTQNRQGWNTAGTGHKLGGEPPDAATSGTHGATCDGRRQKALEAAERRQATIPGVSAEKAADMRRRQQKDEYLGKLTEFYNKKRMDMPMGLSAASVEQLKQHWEQIRKGETTADQILSMQ